MHASNRARWVGRLAVAALSVASVFGAGAAAVAAPTPAKTTVAKAATATKRAPHIMTIMMENTDYSQVAGAAATPYENELYHTYAGFTQAYGWRYPSLPNYVELNTGSTHGITDDCDPGDKGCTNLTGTFFENQLNRAGISWHAYYEDDVSGCNTKSSDDFHGNYDVEHNPFRYFSSFKTLCKDISPFDRLFPELDSADPPAYNFVVPDLDNDGGDNGTMSSGDTWLSAKLPKIMQTKWYQQGGQIVIMYDTGYEDSGGVNGSSGGRIPMEVVSAHTKGMGLIDRPLNTAGVLRSLEHAYGVSYLGDAAKAANGSLGRALVSGRPTGAVPARSMDAAVITSGAKPTVTKSAQALAFNGIARTARGSTVEVGENGRGQGVVATAAHGVVAVPGASNLESVSCTTATQCYAVGLGPVGSDQGVLVSIVNGRPKATHLEKAWYGLYGIDCPTTNTCVAVGYATATIGDAVTTITRGVAAPPKHVPGGGEWLNAVSCPTAKECYAAGLVNYVASIVPIASGTPKKAIATAGAWYLSGIDCRRVGDCVVVGESGKEQGVVGTLTHGQATKVKVVAHTGYLYGVGCGTTRCVLAGASTIGKTGYSGGTLATYAYGRAGAAKAVRGTNGIGQVVCGKYVSSCRAAGATI